MQHRTEALPFRETEASTGALKGRQERNTLGEYTVGFLFEPASGAQGC